MRILSLLDISPTLLTTIPLIVTFMYFLWYSSVSKIRSEEPSAIYVAHIRKAGWMMKKQQLQLGSRKVSMVFLLIRAKLDIMGFCTLAPGTCRHTCILGSPYKGRKAKYKDVIK